MKFLCLQPEYVGRFVCDGSKCNSNCCSRSWDIAIDEDTYKKYLQIDSHITEHIKFNAKKNQYLVTKRPCPFLTADGLCRIQLEHGEDFLSTVCITYPRITRRLDKIFERSMTLTCPVVAEMIFFDSAPMKFEFVLLPEKNLGITPLTVPEKFLPHVVDIQLAQISILQERTLTIAQRLIVLGFFLDKLDELSAADKLDDIALSKLLAAYESKKFLAEQVPRLLAVVPFDKKNFADLMSTLLNDLYGANEGGRYLNTLIANHERLADERKKFSARYSTFMENYLVNEIFMNCYPWRFLEPIAVNFALFVTTYKIFELVMFATTRSGFDSKDDLLKVVEEFSVKLDHTRGFYEKVFDRIKKLDIFTVMKILPED